MRIALIADAFPPMRISSAIQLRDLCFTLVEQGHEPTVLTPVSEQKEPWQMEMWNGVRIVRLKSPKTKDVGYARRTVGECLMPYAMRYNLRKSPLANERWDGIVWYSPSIFFAPIVKLLKQRSACRSYLIIRDIFPEWVVDMGLIRRGLPYHFFKMIEHFQYSIADVVGVQTPASLAYFDVWKKHPDRQLEVLQNWLRQAPNIGCSISIAKTALVGRKIFVYAGNMGVAQGITVLLNLAERLKSRKEIGFLFVGRGSHVQPLRVEASARGLDNVVFFDEIDPEEIPGLYAQCHIGLVMLDSRHKTHNIPGKFISYMQNGLPVLANINPGNDLVDLITQKRVGKVCTEPSVDTLQRLAESLLDELADDDKVQSRCQLLAAQLFSAEVAAQQIIRALSV